MTTRVESDLLIIAEAEKAKHAAELIIANTGKARRAAELVIANAKKAKRAAVLLIANIEKGRQEDKLVDDDKELTYQHEEKIRLAAELVIADLNRTTLDAELVIDNIDEAKRAAELVTANKELVSQKSKKSKLASAEVIAAAEKAKLESEIVIANIKKAKRAAELVIENVEKTQRSAELVIANKELVYQKAEKAKRAAEVLIANVEKAKRAAELVIANIEKAKQAAQLLCMNKELMLAKEKEKLTAELMVLNKELTHQIDKRKESDRKLKESNKRFYSYIKHSPVGIFVVGKTGRYYDCNPAACDMVGYTRKEILSMSIIDLLPVEEREKGLENFQKLLEYGSNKFEIKLLRKDKSTVYVILEAVRLPQNNMFMAFNTDIEKIKNAEFELKNKYDEIEAINRQLGETNDELIEAKEKAEESDRLKSAFLTNMSHEIRTPMNGILGFAELLNEPNLTSVEIKDYIQTIQISGARMLNTINSIVDISKIESGLVRVDIMETNINEKTEFVYKFFKQEVENKALLFSLQNSLPTKEAIIKTDSEKVYAILTNLVKNAIKFTYDGSIEFGYEKRGDYLEFFVKDTGVGIPKNHTGLIFERFRQGSELHNRGFEGSGLGLAICKSYVEMLGGRIWVESTENSGSTFYFTIPYNPVPEEKPTVKDAVSEEPKDVHVKKLKILIVEDDDISYTLLNIMLEKIGSELLRAETGVEAVDACRNNPDFDLILMDIRMPQMDGNEAARRIRQFNKDVIIIAQTAYGFSNDREKALKAGCNDYITKPINMTLLVGLIEKYVKK